MKLTLLEMVQDILSDMKENDVNTIGDTEISNKVLRILKSVFQEVIVRKDWPHLRTGGTLQNVSDSARPTHMLVPSDSTKIEYIAYSKQLDVNDRIVFRPVEYKYPDDFLRYISARNTDNANVDTVTDGGGVILYVLNDTPPKFYTSFDDKNVVFDSYVKDISSTLISSNSQCVYFRAPLWSSEDSFVPDLPSEAFPLFLAEAKSTCFARINDEPDQKSEQQATRQNSAMAQRNWNVKGGIRYNNYGRQSGKSRTFGRNFNPSQYTGGNS